MKTIIAGAGAMGARFGVFLKEAGKDVILVDGWHEHIDSIRKNGLLVQRDEREYAIEIPIFHQDEINENIKCDLIVLFTKAMQLDSMLTSLKPIITENTKILCLLNGIGHEEIIEKYVPRKNIYIGNTLLAGGLNGPGKVKIFGTGAVSLKNLEPGFENEAKEIVEYLRSADIEGVYSEDIMLTIYKKACINGTMNGLCTILLGYMAEVGETSVFEDIIRSIISEFALVANAENINLDAEEMVSFIKSKTIDRSNIGLHYPSMYQDLIKNNRLTEIDYINGVIVKKGEKYGIPTPYCKFLTQLVHAKEEILGAK